MIIWEDRSHMGVKPELKAVTDIATYYIEVRGPKKLVRWWRVGADMPIDAPSIEWAKKDVAEDYLGLRGGAAVTVKGEAK